VHAPRNSINFSHIGEGEEKDPAKIAGLERINSPTRTTHPRGEIKDCRYGLRNDASVSTEKRRQSQRRTVREIPYHRLETVKGKGTFVDSDITNRGRGQASLSKAAKRELRGPGGCQSQDARGSNSPVRDDLSPCSQKEDTRPDRLFSEGQGTREKKPERSSAREGGLRHRRQKRGELLNSHID